MRGFPCCTKSIVLSDTQSYPCRVHNWWAEVSSISLNDIRASDHLGVAVTLDWRPVCCLNFRLCVSFTDMLLCCHFPNDPYLEALKTVSGP